MTMMMEMMMMEKLLLLQTLMVVKTPLLELELELVLALALGLGLQLVHKLVHDGSAPSYPLASSGRKRTTSCS